MSKNAIVPGCHDDLESCLASDYHCIPTFEYRIANLTLPLGRSDVSLLQNIPINLFVADPNQQINNPKFAASNAVSQNSLEILGHFLLMGVCVYAVAEGMACSIEGNCAGDQDTVEADFASPTVLRNDPGYFAQLGLPEGVVPEMAEVNYGNACWRMLENFMAGYNFKLYCPDNPNAQLLEEPVSEIGNCCSLNDWSGFSRTDHGVAYIERSVNDRLAAVVAAGDAPQGLNYDQRFRVLNALQGPAASINPFEPGDLIPQRQMPVPAAFGRVRSNPSIAYWYKLPCAIPLEPGTLLRLEFDSDAGHAEYVQEMIRVATMRLLSAWEGQTTDNFPINENGLIGTARGRKFYIPHGRVRIGIGLKGFRVAQNVCSMMASQLMSGQTSLDVLKHVCQKSLAGRTSCGC